VYRGMIETQNRPPTKSPNPVFSEIPYFGGAGALR
jgi:hypothetical protein